MYPRNDSLALQNQIRGFWSVRSLDVCILTECFVCLMLLGEPTGKEMKGFTSLLWLFCLHLLEADGK